MNFLVSFSQPARSAAGLLAVRLPEPVTARTGCTLPFAALPPTALPAAEAASAPPPRRPSRDVHQASYYAQCRAAMGY